MSSFTFYKHKDFSANAPENTMKAPHYHAFNPTRILGFCLLSLICGLPFPMIVITGDDIYCNVPLVSFVMCIFVACVFDKAYRILNDGTVQKIIKSLCLCFVIWLFSTLFIYCLAYIDLGFGGKTVNTGIGLFVFICLSRIVIR
mgnify:FL=1